MGINRINEANMATIEFSNGSFIDVFWSETSAVIIVFDNKEKSTITIRLSLDHSGNCRISLSYMNIPLGNSDQYHFEIRSNGKCLQCAENFVNKSEEEEQACDSDVVIKNTKKVKESTLRFSFAQVAITTEDFYKRKENRIQEKVRKNPVRKRRRKRRQSWYTSKQRRKQRQGRKNKKVDERCHRQNGCTNTDDENGAIKRKNRQLRKKPKTRKKKFNDKKRNKIKKICKYKYLGIIPIYAVNRVKKKNILLSTVNENVQKTIPNWIFQDYFRPDPLINKLLIYPLWGQQLQQNETRTILFQQDDVAQRTEERVPATCTAAITTISDGDVKVKGRDDVKNTENGNTLEKTSREEETRDNKMDRDVNCNAVPIVPRIENRMLDEGVRCAVVQTGTSCETYMLLDKEKCCGVEQTNTNSEINDSRLVKDIRFSAKQTVTNPGIDSRALDEYTSPYVAHTNVNDNIEHDMSTCRQHHIRAKPLIDINREYHAGKVTLPVASRETWNLKLTAVPPDSGNFTLKGVPPDSGNYTLKEIPPYSENFRSKGFPLDTDNFTLEGLPPDTENALLKGLPPDSENSPLKGLPPDTKNSPLKGLPPDTENSPLKGLPPDSENYPLKGLPPDTENSPLKGLPNDTENSPLKGLPPDSENSPLKGLPPDTENSPLKGLPPDTENSPLKGLPPGSENSPLKGLPPDTENSPLKGLPNDTENSPLKGLPYDTENSPLKGLPPDSENSPLKGLPPDSENYTLHGVPLDTQCQSNIDVAGNNGIIVSSDRGTSHRENPQQYTSVASTINILLGKKEYRIFGDGINLGPGTAGTGKARQQEVTHERTGPSIVLHGKFRVQPETFSSKTVYLNSSIILLDGDNEGEVRLFLQRRRQGSSPGGVILDSKIIGDKDQWNGRFERGVNYDEIRELGSGTYGQVFLCQTKLNTHEPFKFVIKKIRNEKFNDDEVLVMLRHGMPGKCPQILQLYGIIVNEGHTMVVMEYAEGASLDELKGERNIDKATEALYQLLQGMKYLHDGGTALYDIKPKNMAFRKQGDASSVVYIDHGSAKSLAAPANTNQNFRNGTRRFYPPERHRKLDHPNLRAHDVWTLACSIVVYITGISLVEGSLSLVVRMIRVWEGPHSSSDSLSDLLNQMLHPDPDNRCSVEDALLHKVFEKFRSNVTSSVIV